MIIQLTAFGIGKTVSLIVHSNLVTNCNRGIKKLVFPPKEENQGGEGSRNHAIEVNSCGGRDD